MMSRLLRVALPRAISGSLALLLLTVGLQLATGPAQAAPVAGTLTASVDGSVTKSEQVRLTGSLPPDIARRVTLQRRIGNRAWSNLRARTSNEAGSFVFAVTMPSRVGVNVSYRVHAPRARRAGTTYPAVQTPRVSFRTVRQTAAFAAPDNAPAGSSYLMSATFGPARPGRPVALQRREGTTWVDTTVQPQDADGAADFDLQAGLVGTGTWRAVARRHNGSPRMVSETRTVEVTAADDTTPPPTPTLVSAVAGDGLVDLEWSAPVADDLAGYRVYEASQSEGPWTAVDEITGEDYQVTGLENGSTYWFTVSSVDATGNESDRSTPMSATPVDTTPPPVVTLLSATPGDQEVTLVWEASGDDDLAAYRVYLGTSVTGPFSQVGDDVTTTEHTVDGLENGTTYWFYVTGVDSAGNESDPSAPQGAVPVDSTAPPVPGGFTADDGDAQASLSWDAVTAGDLSGYKVWRATSADGPWDLETTVSEAMTEHTVTGLTNGVTYWWAVSSVDEAGNESDLSTAADATPQDTTPPPVPTNVIAQPGDTQVGLSWETVTTSDHAGFHVYTAPAAEGPWTRLTDAPDSASPYDVAGLTNGTTVWFAVTSIDANGNESDPSTAVSATPADSTAPPAPTGLTVTPGDEQVELGWDPVTAEDLAGYRVLRALDASGPWTTLNATPTPETSYVDRDVENETTYWYAVVSVDESGNQSAPLEPMQAVPQDLTAPGATLSAGFGHTCEVRGDSSLWCWGLNSVGRLGDGTTVNRGSPVRVGSSSDWASVAAGGLHTCALKTDGSAWCWGWNLYSQLGDGSSVDRYEPVQVGTATDWESLSSGHAHTCGLRTGGTAWCWGANAHGQLGDGATEDRSTPVQVGTDTDWVALTAGDNHTCGIKVDGTGRCWGNNEYGELGIDASSSWATLTTGFAHTCGTKTDGTAWCWGNDGWGQLGDGATSSSERGPVQVGTASDWATLTVGGGHTCGTKTDGSMWCWGHNFNGQVGDGSLTARDAPVRIGAGTSWTSVTAGRNHTCAEAVDGSLHCWGTNTRGELGDGHNGVELTPAPLTDDAGGWVAHSAGNGHTCGTKVDGTAWCWGYNGQGQLGHGTTSIGGGDPVQVGTGTDWATLTAGGTHTCGTQTDGTAWCWGPNAVGQLGDGTSTRRPSPAQVGTGTDWVTLTAGYDHTCGTRTDGTAWCWGRNFYGQLGDGTSTGRLVPVQVGDATDWASLAAGSSHTCGTKTDGTAWCWGRNTYGQLGDGTSTGRPGPVQVGAATDWATLTAGEYHTCGTKGDGTAWCWGYNGWSQLGDGTSTGRLGPVQVGAGTDWATLTAGSSHTCGTRADGTAWCWGDNGVGQVGDDTTTDRSAPVQVGDATDWTTLTAGNSHTCGTKTDGTARCWGWNPHGQLGIPSYRTAPWPVQP